MSRLPAPAVLVPLAVCSVLLAGCGGGGEDTPAATSGSSASVAPPSAAGSSDASTSPAPSTGGSVGASAAPAKGSVKVDGVLASGFDVPWGLARLPGGTGADKGAVLVSTRDDQRIWRVSLADGAKSVVGTVPGVLSDPDSGSEGGLLGIAVSPDFAKDRRVYVYYSTSQDNRIAWMRYDASAPAGRQLGRATVIVPGIPHGIHHNGGRIAFGPDGMLYAGTGEAEDKPLAQDKGSLGGKVLRMTPDGKPAPGNPFGTLVYTYGHRNVQGLAFDPAGRVWEGEFGDKTADELNLLHPGANYGWPDTQGKTSNKAYTSPVAQFGTDEDSPSGIAYAAGSIWMAALQGERLWRIPLDGASAAAQPTDFLTEKYGRLRSVLALDDHTLLLTTSNRDGRRSTVRDDDDQILRVTVR